MIVTYRGLSSYLITTNTYSRESSINNLNDLVNIVYFIQVDVKVFFVLYNIICDAKIYNLFSFYLCNIGIG